MYSISLSVKRVEVTAVSGVQYHFEINLWKTIQVCDGKLAAMVRGRENGLQLVHGSTEARFRTSDIRPRRHYGICM